MNLLPFYFFYRLNSFFMFNFIFPKFTVLQLVWVRGFAVLPWSLSGLCNTNSVWTIPPKKSLYPRRLLIFLTSWTYIINIYLSVWIFLFLQLNASTLIFINWVVPLLIIAQSSALMDVYYEFVGVSVKWSIHIWNSPLFTQVWIVIKSNL